MKPVGTRILTTPRLVLRPVKADDAEALVQIHSIAMSLADAVTTVKRMADELQKPFTFHWVITLDGTVIGRIKAWDVNPYNGYLQLGYDIAPECRGNGYMTEALTAAIRFLMTVAQVNRIFCSVRESNYASRRVCEKSGMTHEGTLRQHYARQDGGYDNVCIYGILACELFEECE